LIQITLMFGAALYVFFWLLGKTGGWEALQSSVVAPVVIDTGIRPGKNFGEHVHFILTQEYTIWAALLGSIFTTRATHGTDQDMVQRMITSKDAKRGQRAVIISGLIDLPVVVGFLAIGILVWKYYEMFPGNKPVGDPGIFAWFMGHDLKPGVRGLIAAGLFATAMGSLSTALNALATTFTKDWYLGVFLVGMLTKTRGSCKGNLLGMIAGFVAVGFLTNLPNDIWNMLLGHPLYKNPDWLPIIAFTWRIMFGTLVTVGVAFCFRSKPNRMLTAGV